MSAQEVLEILGGQEAVRVYLRGVDPGSEVGRDAQRSMLAAIAAMRGAGVQDAMAQAEPELYAQACLLLCRMWTDAEDGAAEKIVDQFRSAMLALRYDNRNQ